MSGEVGKVHSRKLTSKIQVPISLVCVGRAKFRALGQKIPPAFFVLRECSGLP
jgi:hypothetical protein